MAHMITVTIAGGSLHGPLNDTKISLNADNISSIVENDDSGDVGRSIITMIDKKRHHVQETRDELNKLINSK